MMMIMMIIWRTNFLLLFLLIFPFQQNVSRRKTKARRRFPTCFLFHHLSDVPALLYLACFILLACLLARQEGNTKATRVHFSPATTLDLVLGVQASDSFLSTSIKADRRLFREPGRRRKNKAKKEQTGQTLSSFWRFFPFSLDWMETRLFFVYSFPLYLFPCSFERY